MFVLFYFFYNDISSWENNEQTKYINPIRNTSTEKKLPFLRLVILLQYIVKKLLIIKSLPL